MIFFIFSLCFFLFVDSLGYKYFFCGTCSQSTHVLVWPQQSRFTTTFFFLIHDIDLFHNPQHQSCGIMPKKTLTMNSRCWLSNKLRILEYLFRDNAHPIFFSWYTTHACPLSALAGGTGAADRNYCHKLNSRYGKTRANIAFYAISFGNTSGAV